ncbi:hypothetical protein [Nocardia sp. NPDC046763]
MENTIQLYASVINLLAMENDSAAGTSAASSLERARHRRSTPGVIGPC